MYKLLKGMRFVCLADVISAVMAVVAFYNEERPHMSIDMMPLGTGNGSYDTNAVTCFHPHYSAFLSLSFQSSIALIIRYMAILSLIMNIFLHFI